MSERARGEFDVQAKPLPEDEKVEGLKVGRVSIAKHFRGDLEGESRGEMMTAGTAVAGSAGYVAVEHVTGALRGRSGTFTLLHQGTMRGNGDFKIAIVVVPDSGTDGLLGLTGTMEITIEAGRHSYALDYALPGASA
jgi:hypothetical protein